MSFSIFLTKFSVLDWFGFALFLVCWVGFERIVDHAAPGRRSLHLETNKLRAHWGYVMCQRDPRVVDSSLINNLLPSLSFYANTSIYIIGALFAALGALDQLMATASDLPFSRGLSREATEFKLLVLIAVFVVAYFKFTWSLRQFNILSITLGATPLHHEDPKRLERYARKFAAVLTCAGHDFNRGLRAYYFGVAIMAWMVSAWSFILSTLFIVIVIARREFASPVLKALVEIDEEEAE